MSAESQLLRSGRQAWAVLGLTAVAALALYGLHQVRVVVIAFVLALFPAALLSPLASRLRDSRIPNGLSALALVVVLLLVIVVPVRLIVPLIADQAPKLDDAVSNGLQQLQSVVDLPWRPEGPRELAQEALESLAEGGAAGQGLAAATTAVSVVAGLLLLIVVLFFLLKDGRRLWTAVLDLIPESRRESIDAMASTAWWTLGAYFRGQLLIALFDAAFIGLGLWLLGVPLPLPLAVLVFFGALFPIVGAFVSGLIAVLVALADQGLVTAGLTLALIIVVQQVEGNVFQPIVMSTMVALHPLVIILVVTAGGLLLGILGAFLAVPIAAITARMVDHIRGREAAAGPNHG